MFPATFEKAVYKYFNRNILYTVLDENHYNDIGKQQGCICSRIYNRKQLINCINTLKIKCLEIGPFDNPNLIGKNVKYFDVLNQELLKKRAAELPKRSEENVPFIHYVNSKGDLKIIDEKFDLVLSCHSIEHQLNFIQHLIDVSCILNNNGYYVIILPDKRYCFDHFIKESTIADIISQYITNSKLHSLKSIIEHRALTCHNNKQRHWQKDHGHPNYISNPNIIKQAIGEYEASVSKNEYLDVHSLQFTPDSFKNIINLLNQLNYINLVIDKVYQTVKGANEFYVILKKN